MRTVDLETLNSATKYPSIPTYHVLGEKGRLTEEAIRFPDRVYLSEKVDGSGARIVVFPDGDYLLGSREEFLYAKGDLLRNPAQGIADALRATADRIKAPADGIRVYYLEVYGGKIGAAAKEYSGSGSVSFRMFDAVALPFRELAQSRERISAWRQGGGQEFLAEGDLRDLAEDAGLVVTPRLGEVHPDGLPTTVAEMSAFLTETLPTTGVGLDSGAGGSPEGIVLRTRDRSVIAKARFQDYRRTLKQAAKGRG